MRIMLIHGMGRTTYSMALLGRRLRRRGHSIRYFGYSPLFKTFDGITREFAEAVRSETDEGPYAIVGHSLGGIIARAALPLLQDHPPERLIMLGPPNRSPLLARRLHLRRLYRTLFGDCGQRLAEPEFYRSLPYPDLPCTIIAGTSGFYGRLSPFGRQANDGIVTVEETRMGSGEDHREFKAYHSFLMNAKLLPSLIDDLLNVALPPDRPRRS